MAINSPDTLLSEEKKRRFSTKNTGYLLGKWGLIALLAVFLIAVWYRQTAIAVLLGLVLSTAGLSRLWSRLSLVGVTYHRTFSEKRAFPGEAIQVKLSLTNRKLLPLPWIQADDAIPLAFSSDVKLIPTEQPSTGLLVSNTAMSWYSETSWNHQLHCNRRGYYQLGPLTITSGDIFGLYPRSIQDDKIDYLIVYPRIIPLEQLDIPSLYPLGETKAEQRIFEDPTRTIGVRDYTPQDSLRHVHWKASARHQNLQIKVFEPTTTLNVALFLAVDSYQQFNQQGAILYQYQQETEANQTDEEFESGISLTASLAKYILDQHSTAGLFVNTKLVDSGQPAEIQPGRSDDQLINILETLAKVTSKSSSSFSKYLQSVRNKLPWGTTIIVVASFISLEMHTLLTDLIESGYKLMIVRTFGGDTPTFAIHTVKHSEELARAVQEKC